MGEAWTPNGFKLAKKILACRFITPSCFLAKSFRYCRDLRCTAADKRSTENKLILLSISMTGMAAKISILILLQNRSVANKNTIM